MDTSEASRDHQLKAKKPRRDRGILAVGPLTIVIAGNHGVMFLGVSHCAGTLRLPAFRRRAGPILK